ncbi:GNAT family N-acetyltransferase [Ruegeria sp. 2205SS24-7]|uniref:GNAT family N-acetyltransferase n=1 Tax=Ruegeria discodermiae TaxID=3064389 RepID=UPI00274077AD|nr:GNAT family N-acetyltransferase [Ruegeria sp. 2205SS24-7]MDP5216796.1 GNAT family N-acetyltransferase [Ruegeria sp. 2205SS24-7]
MPEFSTAPPSIAEFRALRDAAGLGSFSIAATEIALANTLHGVWLRERDTLIGMARLIGDGGCFAQVTDVTVHPRFQGRGHGGTIMRRLMTWAHEHLPPDCYISLIADPGAERLYASAGFSPRTGMARTAG